MPKNPSLRSPVFTAVFCLLAVALAFVPSWSWAAGSCSIFSPADQPRATPQALWGELKPVGVILDATAYTGNQRADSRFPQPTSLDIENGFLFASYWAGFGIWDLRSTPEAPVKLSLIDGWQGAFPQWILGQSETDQFVYTIDAPAGDDSIIALGGISPIGLSIWDTRNKSAPVPLYQDATGKEIAQVWATTIGGRAYAFAGGAFSGGEFGLFIYDMTAARTYNKCVEDVSHGSRNCPGVYIAKVPTGGGQVQYVQGLQYGSKTFVVTSPGQSSIHGVQIWDVTNPASPSRVVVDFTGNGLANFTSGVAMWQQGNTPYLAVRFQDTLRVFDITTCLTNGCAALPGPIASLPVAAAVDSNYWKTVSFSRSGSTPMLFLGNHQLCHSGQGSQHIEYALDMSNPAQPRDIAPPQTTTYQNEAVDYWSYYYPDDVKGFAFSASRDGKFYQAPNGNSYLYRADLTLFDVHQWTGGGGTAPIANFNWSPSSVFAGDTVTFSDTSAGLVSSRSWSFPGGGPASGSTTPINVVYSTPGSKTVTLNVSNSNGSNQVSKSVLVLDPSPVVQGVSNPATIPVCGTVAWSANGVTGRAPLTISWAIKNGLGATVASGTGNPFSWDSTGQSPGPYTGTVTVSNGTGTPATASGSVLLNAPDPLPAAGQFAPGKDAFSFGTVTFHANVSGATSWNWDFGDGQGYRGWTGPYAVASPTFTYSAAGNYSVKVKVKNCVQTTEVESAGLPVAITQVQPLLIQTFQAQCNLAPCSFSANQAITFNQTILGSPTQLQYDWDGNGSWDETVTFTAGQQPDPSKTHTYTTPGQYAPKLRATRGTEPPVDFSHPSFIVDNGSGGGGGGGGGGQTPVLTVNGPVSGNINQALTFSATASNCTPSATWSWNAGGGTLSGSGSSVSITWPSVGNKSVTVTNTGCSGTTGQKSVAITDGSGGGGGGGGNNGLAAGFTFSPASPNVGQAVSFDGSSSTGSPTVFTWDFGDGQTGNGSTASHAYTTGGTFTVKLEVGKQGTGCPFGVCSATLSKTITVAGGPPALVASFDTSAQCIADFAGLRCSADVGTPVTFTSTTANATSYSWSFGDGGTANGAQVSHTWTQPGTSYVVQLTVSDGRTQATTTRNFVLSGNPVSGKKAVILPWIAQTRGALVQSSDLYVLNPGTAAIDVSLQFLKRGTPETNPPKITKTIQPGSTLYVADALREMFNRENVAGFITLNVDKGDVEPIITSFNTTLQSDGSQYGQTVPGISMSSTGSSVGTGAGQTQNLVGLSDNSERLSYFGVSNPGQDTLTYTLRFFDNLGKQIGTPHDLVVSRFGQRQFQIQEIRDLFGISNQDDYRVQIQTASGQVFPYASNLRLGSQDPSFVGVGSASAAKVYLIGAMSTPGLNKSTWLSDAVLSNTSSDVVITDITFTGTGVTATSTSPIHVTLHAGETRRLSDIIGQQWGLRNTVGVITLDSNAPGGVFPIVQGESYENTNPNKRFGQSMPAVFESQAAGVNAAQYLVGLRQDAKNRTTFWIFNPGSEPGVYDIVYLGLDGHELGRFSGVAMQPGKIRQFSPGQHPLPAGGVQSGFTVQVRVKSGKVLAAAQVINNATNDPAYIQGATR